MNYFTNGAPYVMHHLCFCSKMFGVRNTGVALRGFCFCARGARGKVLIFFMFFYHFFQCWTFRLFVCLLVCLFYLFVRLFGTHFTFCLAFFSMCPPSRSPPVLLLFSSCGPDMTFEVDWALKKQLSIHPSSPIQSYPIHPSIHISIHLSISIYPSIHPSIYLSTYLPIHPSIYLI